MSADAERVSGGLHRTGIANQYPRSSLCPRELLRQRARETEFGLYVHLTVSCISDMVNKGGEMLTCYTNDSLIAKSSVFKRIQVF
jgi:hypothetical protein